MSNLVKALKRAEQDRRKKLEEDEAPVSPEFASNSPAEDPVDSRKNPLLGKGEPDATSLPTLSSRGISPTAMVVLLALAVMVAGNIGYWARGRNAAIPAGPAMATSTASAKPQAGGVPHGLLTGDPIPLQLRLDRRTEILGDAIAR